jgi:hypothetical protein
MGIKLKITLTREQSFELRARAKYRRWCPECKADSEFVEMSDAEGDFIAAETHRSVVDGREYLCLGPVTGNESSEPKQD